MLAAHRAREISSGSEITVPRDNDKNPVVSLREIADKTVPLEKLDEGLIKSLQKHVEPDIIDEDVEEEIAATQDWVKNPESSTMSEEISEDELSIESDTQLAAQSEEAQASTSEEETGVTLETEDTTIEKEEELAHDEPMEKVKAE